MSYVGENMNKIQKLTQVIRDNLEKINRTAGGGKQYGSWKIN